MSRSKFEILKVSTPELEGNQISMVQKKCIQKSKLLIASEQMEHGTIRSIFTELYLKVLCAELATEEFMLLSHMLL